ncbi:hypothetical protein J4Q44_G00037830 [Coregonus suidteri]|uniref:Uncharacterized protein n=1 Tax=Coregonus suidteri TaxID=861788 RepID=A0AAN8R464_9TELE
MIPGPHCAARPYQVYLISGIARWNSDRSGDAVFGGKGRHHRTYSAPLIDRLNARCQQLFGETVEENFRAPADVSSNELLGLEYLFSQSTGESGPFSLQDIVNDGPGPEEEVLRPGQPDPDDADEAYQSDVEAHDRALDAVLPHITLTSDETATVHPPAFEDACSPNPLPGFPKLEMFCSVLVEIGLAEEKLSLTTEQRNQVLKAWNAVEEHDKQPQKFNQLYRTHWGNTLYCRTKRDDLVDAALIQRVKMAKRYAPAQQDISAQHNRLMYTLVKLLWLRSPQGSRNSPEKRTLLKAYERVQHRILVEDPVLCKAGIPLPRLTARLCRTLSVAKRGSSTCTPQNSPPPSLRPPPSHLQTFHQHHISLQSSLHQTTPLMEYVPTPSTAGTKVLKGRTDMMAPLSRPQPPMPHLLLPPPGPHCAARPYQVYLISGIARWNSDRSGDAVFGGKGRHHRTYSAPLIDRLNARCQQLFRERLWRRISGPLLMSLPTSCSGWSTCSARARGNLGPSLFRTLSTMDLVQKRRCSDLGSLIQMTQTRRTRAMWRHTTVRWMPSCPTSHSPATKPPLFTLRPLRMPAVQTLFLAFLSWKCSALCWWRLAWQKKSCHSHTEQRNQVLKAWNAVEEHDKQPQKFNQLYRTHWGNTLYCRTKKGDDLVDAALIQRVKMAKRYAPAQQDISAQHNRLMYTLVKLLWLRSPQGSRNSPEKRTLLKAYERVQHRILVEDPVLCKAGIPLPKINSKTVQDFIRRQERLLNLHATKQPSTITKTTSISSADLPPAPHQPAVLPPPDYP